jgi:PAS domain S-box-containing protein
MPTPPGPTLAELASGTGEAAFRLIVTSCVEGIALIDPDGAIRYANPQLAALLGVARPEDLLGRTYRDFTAPAAQAEIERRLQLRRSGLADRYEVDLRTADGRAVRVEVSAGLLPAQDGRGGAIAVFRDVTEQRAIDDQVREAQKRESLGVLAGGVAHEFNNLLVGILGNATFVAAELPAGSEARAAAEDIHAAAVKASTLTRQLLAYSGRGAFSIGPVDLNKVVADMTALATPTLGKQARLVTALQPQLPPVEGDVGQLGQVVLNLLTNASDALIGRGGTITVRTGVVVVSRMAMARYLGAEGLPEGRFVSLEVEDDGPGIDALTRARVFEPFFSTKFTGRGLGLPATLGILKSHRGAVRIDSEPGHGSRLTVLLPLSAGAPPPEGPRATPAPGAMAALQRPTILVADDEEMVRRAARRALERSGFAVVEAADGAQAVASYRADAGRIACVLLDLTMPGMGGEEALAAIRTVSIDVPVVLTSGYTDRDDASAEAVGSAVSFLPKPFGPAELVAAVRAAMGLPPR